MDFLINSFAVAGLILGFINLLLMMVVIRRINQVDLVSQSSSQEHGLPIGDLAPNFTAETLEGNSVNLETYINRNIAFIFLTPDCPPCIEALPVIKASYPKALEAGVELILVSTTDKSSTHTFMIKHDLTIPIIVAPEQENPFLKTYKAPGTPFYCLVDKFGKIQSTGHPHPNHPGWGNLLSNWQVFTSQ